MAGFLDVRLPETFSQGSLFGPGFRTQITELDSLQEQRVQRIPDAGRRFFNVTRGIATIDDLVALQEFGIVVQGSAFSFRIKDWSDYATTPSGTTHRPGDADVTATDEVLQQITTTTYQFVKTYTFGATTVTRPLTKLVAGTPLVAVGGVPQGSGFSVNLLTGIVTFTSDPGATVEGGTEFDVQGRFTVESERALQVGIEAVDTGDLPEVTVVEDFEVVLFNQSIDFGGATNHGDMGGADVSMVELAGRVQIFEPAVPGLAAILPDNTALPTGGPYFFIYNDGTQTLAIEDHVATTLVAALATSSGIEVWLGVDNLNVPTWYAA